VTPLEATTAGWTEERRAAADIHQWILVDLDEDQPTESNEKNR